MMAKKTTLPTEKLEELSPEQEKIQLLETQLAQAQEREKRALADYQNLVRRFREERLQIIKMANQDLILALIEPLENLYKASQQLNDQGLTMVMSQLNQSLASLDVEVIDPLNQPFNLDTMEVIEKKAQGKKVIQVLQRAYKLNGQIIAHAKVVLD